MQLCVMPVVSSNMLTQQRQRNKKRQREGDFLPPAEPDCCRYWRCFDSEPTSADDIVSWVVTKGHCGLIASSEMVSEFLCGVTHTLNRFHTFALIPVQSPRSQLPYKDPCKCEKTQKEQSPNWNISLNYYVIIGL